MYTDSRARLSKNRILISVDIREYNSLRGISKKRLKKEEAYNTNQRSRLSFPELDRLLVRGKLGEGCTVTYFPPSDEHGGYRYVME